MIQIYSTNSHALLAELGDRGRGPKEMEGPSLMKQIAFDSTNNSPVVKVYDFKRKRLNTINILDAINGSGIQIQETLPGRTRYLPYFFFKDDDFYLASPEAGGRFVIYNYKTSETKTIPYLPKLDFAVPFEARPIVYRSAAFVDTEKELIVSAPLFLGELNIFDLQGNLKHSTIFEDRNKFEVELSAGSSSMKNTRYQIVDIDVKNDLIYALNYNNSIVDFYEDRKDRVKVQVFNWEGDPSVEYSLDDRLITSFAIDEIHNRVYAYCPDEETSNIIVYPIK